VFIEAKDDGGGGAGAVGRAKLQSNHHHQHTNTQFFCRPVALPVAQPSVSKHWRENITSRGLAYPKLTWMVFQLCLWPLLAPGYLGGGLPCLSSALWCQYPIEGPYYWITILELCCHWWNIWCWIGQHNKW